ncbi:M1 family metallopeptidase [Rubrivirga sp.]|uniref:M1 family metallopeptidase n=1 Tax=Rubrivirga sp. TaxID=1885344 RepID=UPI003B51D7A9
MRLLLLASALAVAASAQPNDSGLPLEPEQAAFDATYYSLDLAIDPVSRTLDGTLLMEARVVQPTAAVLLDLDAPLAVSSVREVATVVGSGEEVSLPRAFERTGHRLRIRLGRTAQPGEGLRLRIAYGGTPREAPRPPWDGGFTWAETADGTPWIAVSCQIQGADLWWPVKDHPSDEADSVRVALTVPSDLRAISNGRWEGRTDHGDGTATERWFVSTPINNYGVSFGIGPYETVEMEYVSPIGYTATVPFFVIPERVEDARRQLPSLLADLAFLERTFGPYPWRADGYKILHTPYLGMEHQSLVAYGSTFEDNAFGFDWLHFHELAHEWWANLGSAPDWRDFWVHESFASYAEALRAEDVARRAGADADSAYLAFMQGKRGGHRDAIAVAPRETRTTQQMYALADGRSNGDIYVKGAWVLHSLRYLIDDDPRFFDAMRSLLYPSVEAESVTDGRQARWVSTDDVLAAFSRAAGRDLSGAFEVYLRQPAPPRLAVDRSEGDVVLRWLVPEAAGDAVFDMPVEVSVDGVVQRVAMPDGVGRFAASAGSTVKIDPNGRVLFEPAE